MIEDLDDKMGGQPTIGRRQREFTAWRALPVHFRLQDCYRVDEFRKTSQKQFWDNRQASFLMICSRLDRFYLNHTLIQIDGQTSIKPMLANVSDQSPTFVCLQPRQTKIQHTPAFC